MSVTRHWDGKPSDLLIALHAKRSSASVDSYKKAYPSRPVVVVLTGTDLYRDLPGSKEARRSLDLADRIIVLQEDALRLLPRHIRSKARTVYQSSSASIRHSPPRDRFRVIVVGHLRDEKDPFRAARSLAYLEGFHDLEVVQVGSAMSPEMALEAKRLQKREPRYRWIGSVPHARALGWIARSHALVVSSKMEGGANVICEAARIGTPVLGSRVSGNLGMLGRRYPGLFRLFDERGLAKLICKLSSDKRFYAEVKKALSARRHLFSPAAERASLNRVVRKALESAP